MVLLCITTAVYIEINWPKQKCIVLCCHVISFQDIASEHPERFFVGEIVREKIFVQYRQEIPYACQVHLPCFLISLMQYAFHFAKPAFLS
jgi:hypothetical protein